MPALEESSTTNYTPVGESPILIYDGDCHFCSRWVARWQAQTGPAVQYETFQKVGFRYPEISEQSFRGAVHLVEPGRKISHAAEAVFRTLSYAPQGKWRLGVYRIFKPVFELFYKVVAANRVFFSKISRLLWGPNYQPSTFKISSWLFLKGLSLIYLIAFASMGVQILGLIGSEGVLPISEYFGFLSERFGNGKFFAAPSVFWINASDLALQAVCWAGVALSIVALLGFFSGITQLALWVLYLSIVTVGQDFLSFQWDILLLEAGFLSIFLVPFAVRTKLNQNFQPSKLFGFLFRWLLFRLMFLSGCVKLASGDQVWRMFRALDFHYETQPLPTFLGWYAHHLPNIFHKISVIGMFAIELAVPFLFFLPRRLRHFSAFVMIGFQSLIILTGNYGFFNLLSIFLCLFLIDDTFWPKKIQEKVDSVHPVVSERRISKPILATLGVLIFALGFMNMTRSLGVPIPWPKPVIAFHYMLRPLHITNNYGLFARMTTRRSEIVIEGSQDGQEWESYEFKYKPGDLAKAPSFIAPFQPRIDWQMWFAALGDVRSNPWFYKLSQRMLLGSEEVLKVFKTNPFEEGPPRFIRAAFYDYHFSTPEIKSETGKWWTRERKGLYMRTMIRPDQD